MLKLDSLVKITHHKHVLIQLLFTFCMEQNTGVKWSNPFD